MIYEAVLFDMDGVVIDTQGSVTAFWNNLAHAHGVRLSTADYNLHIYGCPATHTLDTMFPQLEFDQRLSALTALNDYEAGLSYAPVPGVVTLLRALKRQAVPSALVTSGDRKKVGEVIRQLGLGHLFQARVTADDVVRGKPNPDCYQLAAQQLGRQPERCIVFEDSLSGATAAMAAGALCVGVQGPERAGALRAVGAAHIIPDFAAVRVVVGPNGAGPDLSLDMDGGFRLSLETA